MNIEYVEKVMMECAEEELKGPFKKMKLEIVRQSIPAVCACGADESLRDSPPDFQTHVIASTNYEIKTYLLPSWLIINIIAAVVQWLVMRWLDRYLRGYF